MKRHFIRLCLRLAVVAAAGAETCAPFSAQAQTFDLLGVNRILPTLDGYTAATNNGRSAAILSIGLNNASSTFAGTMFDGKVAFGVVQIGAGVLTLTGVNTQTGRVGFIGGAPILAGGVPVSMAAVAGTLAINSGAALGGGGVAISDATLASVGGGPITISNNLLIGVARSAMATIDTSGGDIHITSAIYGYQPPGSASALDGGLTKVGLGSLILSGASSYAGPTLVAQGALEVDGSIISPTTIAQGAFLRGVGTVGAINVGPGATLAPGNGAQPYGALHATGNVSFAPGSVFSVALSPGGTSQLATTGSASLAGTVAVASSGASPAVGSRYLILSAAGGVTGVFQGISLSGASSLLPVLAYDSNDVYLAFNGMTAQTAQTSFQTLANDRTGSLVTYQVLANVLDGFNEQINCSNCVSAFGSVGSLSVGVHGRYTINDELALLGGAAIAQYHSGEINVTSSPIFLAALRYDKTSWGASRPFAEVGVAASPWQTVDMKRTYFDGIAWRQGLGATNAESYIAFGKLGWVTRWSDIDEGSIYGGLSRVWQFGDGYAENSLNNILPATIDPGTAAVNVARVGAQWTHLFVPNLESQINLALAQSFGSQSGLSGSVLGFSNIRTTANNYTWAEYGLRLGYRVANNIVVDVFADGTLGPQPIGDTIHGGLGLRYAF